MSNEEEEPVKEHHTVWLTTSPMFVILNGINTDEGEKEKDGGPESKVTGPDMREVFDL